jgi:hypothetical protein
LYQSAKSRAAASLIFAAAAGPSGSLPDIGLVPGTEVVGRIGFKIEA